MHQPITRTLRGARLFMKSVAMAVAVAHLMLVTAPAVAAVRHDAERKAQTAERPRSDERRLDDVLQEAEQRLARLKERATANHDITADKEELKRLRKTIRELDRTVTANFDAVEKRLRDKKVPDLILDRHREAVETYRTELEALLDGMRRVDTAKDNEVLKREADKAKKRLEGKKHKRAHQPFDPNNLPHRSHRPGKDNKPRTKRDEFTASGLFDTPYPKLAALGGFTYDALPGATDPAYLAESPEVVLTDAIRAKAAELNHDPVQIYHWVRNNVEWLPNWGAMQDADVTLGSRKGNALDIAGLTIALLRASGVPARYVHGTVEVPEARFRNWAGGFQDTAEAAVFAASGGIPVTAITEAGGIGRIRLEHVWVEAAIDYYPSRGAVMREADAWVELDPAFKQYEYLEGLDAAALAGIDGEALAQSFVQSGSVNEAEGWVQGLDATVLQNAQAQMQTALEAHIQNNMTDPTVGDVIGGRKVIVQEFPNLPSALPNRIVVKGARYGELPDALRHRITFGLGTDLFGEPLNPVTVPYARVNNHQVTLSFRPATAADEQALLALLPEGEITDLSQLPQSISSYLVRVVPELKVEGNVILAGQSIRLGEDQPFAFRFLYPDGPSAVYQSPVVAGSYLALATVGGSVSVQKLGELQTKLAATKSKLESQDQAQLASLTREDVLGDMFHAGVLGYYAEYQALGYLAALSQGSHYQLLPSAGTYGYAPEVNYLFGFPTAIRPGGIEMDLDAIGGASSVDGKGKEAWKGFNFQMGAISSALEHAIPEQMFVTPENPGEAVSAVKALQKAAQAGQRIYHITQANLAAVTPNLRLNGETLDEIRQAVMAGKEVFTHTDPITVPGWKGAGYVITDPGTGDGAWKIGGGANGGVFKALSFSLLVAGMLYSTLSALSSAFAFANPVLSTIANFIALASAFTTMLKSALECGGSALTVLILAITGLVILALAVQWMFVAMGNPLMALTAGFALKGANEWLRSAISSGPFCAR